MLPKVLSLENYRVGGSYPVILQRKRDSYHPIYHPIYYPIYHPYPASLRITTLAYSHPIERVGVKGVPDSMILVDQAMLRPLADPRRFPRHPLRLAVKTPYILLILKDLYALSIVNAVFKPWESGESNRIRLSTPYPYPYPYQ